ncbi:bifunctional [glutamine synthetase] adenylyltransferase/[glutamine synthetase]-adenylyl-L-tyrosine phosphorylase [Pontivivens insulae]|uniref:Bifunctional glutamine synthetase adenylyltransferase/adenylyl-removing enzyme n=1 Tax=Pontivivens insulae TaxID=1639689 RepID=A0A2R8ABK1_9RHOB|nr:bifunctional [glutamine synthetase] adenylyltransferase/[glutamine synthetase]-adenylyl-L-tyrosine phosphorylase [Pontivivens insulae]RED11235.1 glutamate-ammonia-ligase adenylyltransferase [Pontivivens insulae]SPF29592.1 Bifunctional glutamine synthetase adenylyltransferase/adenylyl-removing enzyme [Pontivivens insulae]
MTLTDRITRFPIACDPEKGERLAEPFTGPLRDLVQGAAGTSNYIAALVGREAGWLIDVSGLEPDDAFKRAMALGAGDPATALRQAKRRVALLTALLDLGGVWSTLDVTRALTRFADMAVWEAARPGIEREIAKGNLQGGTDGTAGFCVLAMGKMGAGELNYSSDIDLICLFDETRYQPDDFATARAAFLRVTKGMVRTLADVTQDGYVFRTDLRLRPDPSVTPVCIAMEAAERYYESAGRTWERAAFIKARPCAGDLEAGAAFLKRLQPFKFRRHLDFAAIRDAEDMLDKIRTHKGLAGRFSVAGHDLKLGQGGIREIEFFAQSRQLILGGRNHDLRGRETLEVLGALAATEWIDAERADLLSRAYMRLRDVEHRVQMLDDAQTHTLPKSDTQRTKVAALDGCDDLAAFDREIAELVQTVHAATAPKQGTERVAESVAPPPMAEDPDVRRILDGWHKLPATRSPRADALLSQLEPEILRRLSEAGDPMAALAQFDGFLRGLPAGVQVFSMLASNPPLMALLVDICAMAPALAQYLGRNSGVFDAVLDRGYFGPLPERAALETQLREILERSADYESILDDTRRWQKEQHFRIGVHLLRDLTDTAGAERAYAALAEASVSALLPAVIAEQAKRHGAPPGNGMCIVGMGRLGSREMTASSDLDLIMIYDAEPDDLSEGRTPLAAGAYYARLTKRLISALTAPTATGRLYEVDMRLRPSGRQGPVAVSLSSFRRYQRDEAWTWEHLALTRARAVAGPAELVAAVDVAIADVLAMPRDGAKVARDVREMRARLLAARADAAQDRWEIKQGPGRLLDIDLYLQARKLVGLPADEAVAEMRARLAILQSIGRVAFAEGFDPSRAGGALISLVLGLTGTDDLGALEAVLMDGAALAAQSIEGGLDAIEAAGP